jgi:hypothetical protein
MVIVYPARRIDGRLVERPVGEVRIDKAIRRQRARLPALDGLAQGGGLGGDKVQADASDRQVAAVGAPARQQTRPHRQRRIVRPKGNLSPAAEQSGERAGVPGCYRRP